MLLPQPGELLKAGKRSKAESGGWVKSDEGPTGLYKKWTANQKMRIAPSGEAETSAASRIGAGLTDRYLDPQTYSEPELKPKSQKIIAGLTDRCPKSLNPEATDTGRI